MFTILKASRQGVCDLTDPRMLICRFRHFRFSLTTRIFLLILVVSLPLSADSQETNPGSAGGDDGVLDSVAGGVTGIVQGVVSGYWGIFLCFLIAVLRLRATRRLKRIYAQVLAGDLKDQDIRRSRKWIYSIALLVLSHILELTAYAISFISLVVPLTLGMFFFPFCFSKINPPFPYPVLAPSLPPSLPPNF